MPIVDYIISYYIVDLAYNRPTIHAVSYMGTQCVAGGKGRVG